LGAAAAGAATFAGGASATTGAAAGGVSVRRPDAPGASGGDAWLLFSRAGVSTRLICDSTKTSFGPPIMTKCSTLSRRTSTSCR
jgi:hypothetical protein